MAGKLTAVKLDRDTWRITGEGGDAYLLAGESEAMMIDAGMSSPDVLALIAGLTDKPVRGVINTHSHFDHTAGNGFFERVFATEGIARSAKNTMGNDPANYRLDYGFTIVRDGDVLDIGGRPLTIAQLDCHSPGNVAILDESRKLLFPGDELETGQVLLLPGYAEQKGQLHGRPAATVETYLRAMQKLQALKGRFDALCPAHNGSPIGPEWLDKYVELAKRILGGEEGKKDCSGRGYHEGMAHFPLAGANYRRGEYDGASLIYCADRLRDTDGDQAAPATELHRMSSHSIYP